MCITTWETGLEKELHQDLSLASTWPTIFMISLLLYLPLYKYRLLSVARVYIELQSMQCSKIVQCIAYSMATVASIWLLTH